MNVDLARWQFATTSIYHFLFVPVTIGLAFLVACLQTRWYRSGNEAHLRLTKFFGTLLVINVAVGVVTGLVQEFEFGMNWSAYSRFVGGVFGAPLAHGAAEPSRREDGDDGPDADPFTNDRSCHVLLLVGGHQYHTRDARCASRFPCRK